MFEKYKHYKNCAEGFEVLSSEEENSLYVQLCLMFVALFEALKCLLNPESLSWLIVISVVIYLVVWL